MALFETGDGIIIELVSVTGCATIQDFTEEGEAIYNDLYKVVIKIQNTELDFCSDLKDGLEAEVKKIFSPIEYNYSMFQKAYGKNPEDPNGIYAETQEFIDSENILMKKIKSDKQWNKIYTRRV